VRAGNGVVLDKRVSTQIHEFINESLIQQTKQGITEEDLDDDSGREIISAGTGSEYEDQIQAKGTRKLAGIFPDSVFIIYFNQDSNELTEKAKEKLDRVTEIIFKNPKVDITLNGYTDSIGAPSYNKMVSENRANVVKRYLIGKGVDSSKIPAIKQKKEGVLIGVLKLNLFPDNMINLIEPISKMSFGPISLLVPRFKSSIRLKRTCGFRPTKMIGSGGKSSNAGKLGPAAILNQNSIFEMGSNII
jgi:outer membrane protein OmpA-like peptidoglycan-associated protein